MHRLTTSKTQDAKENILKPLTENALMLMLADLEKNGININEIFHFLAFAPQDPGEKFAELPPEASPTQTDSDSNDFSAEDEIDRIAFALTDSEITQVSEHYDLKDQGQVSEHPDLKDQGQVSEHPDLKDQGQVSEHPHLKDQGQVSEHPDLKDQGPVQDEEIEIFKQLGAQYDKNVEINSPRKEFYARYIVQCCQKAEDLTQLPIIFKNLYQIFFLNEMGSVAYGARLIPILQDKLVKMQEKNKKQILSNYGSNLTHPIISTLIMEMVQQVLGHQPEALSRLYQPEKVPEKKQPPKKELKLTKTPTKSVSEQRLRRIAIEVLTQETAQQYLNDLKARNLDVNEIFYFLDEIFKEAKGEKINVSPERFKKYALSRATNSDKIPVNLEKLFSFLYGENIPIGERNIDILVNIIHNKSADQSDPSLFSYQENLHHPIIKNIILELARMILNRDDQEIIAKHKQTLIAKHNIMIEQFSFQKCELDLEPHEILHQEDITRIKENKEANLANQMEELEKWQSVIREQTPDLFSRIEKVKSLSGARNNLFGKEINEIQQELKKLEADFLEQQINQNEQDEKKAKESNLVRELKTLPSQEQINQKYDRLKIEFKADQKELDDFVTACKQAIKNEMESFVQNQPDDFFAESSAKIHIQRKLAELKAEKEALILKKIEEKNKKIKNQLDMLFMPPAFVRMQEQQALIEKFSKNMRETSEQLIALRQKQIELDKKLTIIEQAFSVEAEVKKSSPTKIERASHPAPRLLKLANSDTFGNHRDVRKKVTPEVKTTPSHLFSAVSTELSDVTTIVQHLSLPEKEKYAAELGNQWKLILGLARAMPDENIVATHQPARVEKKESTPKAPSKPSKPSLLNLFLKPKQPLSPQEQKEMEIKRREAVAKEFIGDLFNPKKIKTPALLAKLVKDFLIATKQSKDVTLHGINIHTDPNKLSPRQTRLLSRIPDICDDFIIASTIFLKDISFLQDTYKKIISHFAEKQLEISIAIVQRKLREKGFQKRTPETQTADLDPQQIKELAILEMISSIEADKKRLFSIAKVLAIRIASIKNPHLSLAQLKSQINVCLEVLAGKLRIEALAKRNPTLMESWSASLKTVPFPTIHATYFSAKLIIDDWYNLLALCHEPSEQKNIQSERDKILLELSKIYNLHIVNKEIKIIEFLNQFMESRNFQIQFQPKDNGLIGMKFDSPMEQHRVLALAQAKMSLENIGDGELHAGLRKAAIKHFIAKVLSFNFSLQEHRDQFIKLYQDFSNPRYVPHTAHNPMLFGNKFNIVTEESKSTVKTPTVRQG